MNPSPEFSIWMLPEPRSESRLMDRIAQLSGVLGAPAFEPHVTVQGDIAQPLARLEAGARLMASHLPQQRWRVAAVDTGDHFFRCLYLRLEAGEGFGQLQAAARALTGTEVGLSPFAHLSLLYDTPQAGHGSLAKELSKEFGDEELVFDRIAVCRSSKDVPIGEWRCLSAYPFIGP